MLHLIWMIIVGFIAGWIAGKIVPGFEQMGFWMTAGLGILGSIVGGLVSRIFSKPADGAVFHTAGILLSIVGAIVVLYVAKMMR